jgi:hypothetical protein
VAERAEAEEYDVASDTGVVKKRIALLRSSGEDDGESEERRARDR